MPTAAEGHSTRYVHTMLQIVDRIYAAACGETPWERAVGEVCQLGKLDGCALSMIDPLERRGVMLAAYGLGCAARENTTVGPIPGNPQLTDRVLRSAPGAVWQDRRIRAEAPPRTGSFRTGGMQPTESVSWACVIVGRHEGQVVCLEVHAGPGRPSDCPELDDFLRQLAPHSRAPGASARRTGRCCRDPRVPCLGQIPPATRRLPPISPGYPRRPGCAPGSD